MEVGGALTKEPDPALVGRELTHGQAGDGGLARAVVTHQGADLALVHVQVEPLQDLGPPIGKAHVPQGHGLFGICHQESASLSFCRF